MKIERNAAAALFAISALLQGQTPEAQPTPVATATTQEAAATAQPSMKEFNIETDRQEFAPFLRKLSAECGVKINLIGYMPGLFSIKLHQVTFERALEAVTKMMGVAVKKHEDGSFSVGHAADLLVEYADPSDSTEVDVTYRCRHLGAESLANVLTKSFPNLRTFVGPLFLSPSLESNANSVGTESVKALSATDQSFKTHDIVITGPANIVKRALILARKFDRVRKQVRINVKLTELSDTLASDLGLSWEFPKVKINEIPDVSGSTVKGIKFGAFNHDAISIAAKIQAQETKGLARTLANPSISVVDGERSFILIGERRIYPKQTGTNANGLPIYDTTEVKTGIYLQVAVQVGLDNELVLTVYPQVSKVDELVSIGGSNYPVISTREAQTTVQLRSGEMLAIGGLLQDNSSKNVTRVPLLGYIPLIGELFTYRHKEGKKTELLLLITPEIIETEGKTESIKLSPHE